MTAAASAGMNTPPIPTNGLNGRPLAGAFRIITTAAKQPTRIHTMRVSRQMGMPSSAARSLLSATARTALPASVRNRNHASPASATGAMTISTTSLTSNNDVPIVKLCGERSVLNGATTSRARVQNAIAN